MRLRRRRGPDLFTRWAEHQAEEEARHPHPSPEIVAAPLCGCNHPTDAHSDDYGCWLCECNSSPGQVPPTEQP